MAAAGLSLTYAELRRSIGNAVGSGHSSTDWGASSRDNTNVNDSLKQGLLQAYHPPGVDGQPPHQWSFLRPTLAELELHASYSTGTVAVAADAGGSIVTLTDGTWPSWAASGEVYVDSAWYTVKSRSSDSVILLDDVSVTVASGASYSLVHRAYDLPDDFGGMAGMFTMRRDQTERTEIRQVHEGRIRQYDDSSGSTGPPIEFALVSVVPTSSQESKWQAVFSPTPDQTYTLWYRYEVAPPMLDGSTYNYAHGYPWFHQVVLASCIDRAYRVFLNSSEKYAEFMEALRGAVYRDRTMTYGQTLGRGARSDDFNNYRDRLDWHRRNSTVTVNVT